MYGLEINKESELSIAKQLENQLRTAILERKLTAGDRLPPTRSLAKDLGIARNTVIQVYEQLIAEGYLESREGSGTYIAEIGRLPAPKQYPVTQRTIKLQEHRNIIAFNAGNPDLTAFPRIKWAKVMKDACLDMDNDSLVCYTGHPKLLQAIRSYVYRVKGIICKDDQILITGGASGGMDLLAKALKAYGNHLAIEDPCIPFVPNIFQNHGYKISPVGVDSQGMMITELQMKEAVDIIYVVPSHQYPIGGVLPAPRRIALLQYASEQNAYVIEDDYDSEFRYKGEALQALRNLAPERVIYIGSFSKIFSPSLRLGYMILPEHLCDQVREQMELSNQYVNTTLQLAMAEFIDQKLLDKHIYRMKKMYEEKRKYLMKCLKETFGNRMVISGEYAGLHLLVRYYRDFTSSDFKAFEALGLEVDHVEDYTLDKGKHQAELVLGYGELSLALMEEGVKRMGQALNESLQS